ncbi:hypothetical protein [Candidatus Tisiphia endosymbiont of Metellina segmentata]|uniref:hypothetical protein n=1 Tax=Candidatus Tisiphia endosymbiont of Metellina segmentata TaxID=3066274 RepID=UPI00313E516C
MTEEKAKKDQQIADLNQAQKDMTKAKDDAVKQLAEKGKEIEALTEAHKAKEQEVADLLKEKQAALQEQAKLAEAVDAQQVKEQEHAVQMADLLKEKQAKDDALKVAQDKLDETVRTPSQSEGLDGYEQPKGLPLLIKIGSVRFFV